MPLVGELARVAAGLSFVAAGLVAWTVRGNHNLAEGEAMGRMFDTTEWHRVVADVRAYVSNVHSWVLALERDRVRGEMTGSRA